MEFKALKEAMDRNYGNILSVAALGGAIYGVAIQKWDEFVYSLIFLSIGRSMQRRENVLQKRMGDLEVRLQQIEETPDPRRDHGL